MLEALLQFGHRRFRRDLSAYVDNMLSERARRRLEAHLDSCQACRQELAELRVTVEALGSLPMAEAPRSFALAAAPVPEVRLRPMAGRLEFGLRLATATAAFALALVIVGDFAGLPGGGEEEEMPAMLAPAADETPAAIEVPPEETPAAIEVSPEETPGATEVAPMETPAPVEAPPEVTPAAVEVAPEERPAADETPAATEVAPVETPAPPAVGYMERYSELAPTPAAAPDVTITEGEEEPLEKRVTEGAGVGEEAEADAAEAQAAAEEEGGGLSREEVVRWLEVGLGAGVGILVVLWALARLQRSIGNRP
jgi:hypothetical protein